MASSMAFLDLIFLACGGLLLAILHGIHFHDEHDEAGDEDPQDAEYHPHTALYLGIFFALAGLTAVELLAPSLLYEAFFVLCAILTILAFVKAGLVALFFMHLKDEHGSVWIWLFLTVVAIGLEFGGVIWDIAMVYGVHV